MIRERAIESRRAGAEMRGPAEPHNEPDPGVAESPLDPALEEDQPSQGWNLSEGLAVLKA